MLIDKRSAVGVPATNAYIFAQLTADSSMDIPTEITQLAYKCGSLQCPDRISSCGIRTYIVTVCQVGF